MKTLYVHIGSLKTGTTAIQKFLSNKNNQQVLKNRGYLYPLFDFEYSRSGKRKNGCFLTHPIDDDDTKRDAYAERKIWDEGFSLIRDLFKTYDNIILSDEMIWEYAAGVRDGLWRELRDEANRGGFLVKIVAYIRRQDLYLYSRWNQLIKFGTLRNNLGTVTWDEFLPDCEKYTTVDYYDFLKKAADVLGKENIIVRVFERKRMEGGSLEKDFAHAIGLSWTDDFKINPNRANERISLNLCEIKRIVNSMSGRDFASDKFFKKIMQDISAESEERYPCAVWNAHDAREFTARFEDGNRKIAEEFMKDGKSLFDDEYKDMQVWEKDNPYMLEDVVRFAAESGRALFKRISAQDEKIAEQSELIKKQEKEIEMLKARLGGQRETDK